MARCARFSAVVPFKVGFNWKARNGWLSREGGFQFTLTLAREKQKLTKEQWVSHARNRVD